MEFRDLVLFVVILSLGLLARSTHPLQTYQTQVLLQLRKHLEYPSQLQTWEAYKGDFCTMSPSPSVTISCQDRTVVELKILGDKFSRGNEFHGYAIPNQTLSHRFSIDSFVTTLTRLPDLKVVSLVSLGMWGPLPHKIHRLKSLEVLDLSSNFLYGAVPPKVSVMHGLQSLILDGNFFNDTFPDWLDSFSNLTSLSLKNNKFKGQVPSSLWNIATITDLSMSQNELSGQLPDLSGLTSLHLLDLRGNHFNSKLPKMPTGLATVLLSNNSFSGKIPEQFGELKQLQHLDLSDNCLTDTPPSTIFSMPKISYLNLANNMLSGSLSDRLNCGKELGFVDISGNRLTGGLPTCLGTNSGERVVKSSGNCLSGSFLHQHERSYCREVHVLGMQSSRKESMLLACIIGGVIIILVILAVASLILFRRYHSRDTIDKEQFPKGVIQDSNSQTSLSAELLANARLISLSMKSTEGAPVYKLFTLEELEEATNGFEISTFLGQGSTGKVYKGTLENGTEVAIRSMSLYRKHSVQSLKLRLELLSKLRHPHLVTLLGHCIDGGGLDHHSASRIFLVYEYMPNGSFRRHLSENNPQKVLKWADRLTILIDVAKAVNFLHIGVIPASYNNRVKTSNILLDNHRNAKLSDYGMSTITGEIEKIEGKTDVSKPWKMERLEDDVYSFGFVLLEALVGPTATGKGDAFLLNDLTSFGSQDSRRKIVDPVVLTTSSQESLSRVISITNKCLSSEPSTRPSFEDVLWNLQYAAQVQASFDAEQRSDGTSQSNP